jgi:hypothetical protein
MTLAFTYHDPDGRYNKVLQRQLGHLRSAFDRICVSVTAPTEAHNGAFLEQLEIGGCAVSYNPSESAIGDHFREALRLAVPLRQPIFFGFIDRVLYAMESEWKASFLSDLAQLKTRPFTIYDRSQLAWDTHPSNYREIEHMVSRMGDWLFGEYLELGLCAFTLSAETADTVVRQSTSPGIEVLGEWVLLAAANGIPITTTKVDWLLWEDPYWEGRDPQAFKLAREQSWDETVKRIRMMTPFMKMMAEDRFRGMRPRIERV